MIILQKMPNINITIATATATTTAIAIANVISPAQEPTRIDCKMIYSLHQVPLLELTCATSRVSGRKETQVSRLVSRNAKKK